MSMMEHTSPPAPETIDLLDPQLMRDPFWAFSRVREQAPLVRGVMPGVEPMWVATRYNDVRQVLSDPRFVADPAHVPGSEPNHRIEQLWRTRGARPEDAKYLRASLFGTDGPEHHRLRRRIVRAFTSRRVARLRPRIETLAHTLLDHLPTHVDPGGVVDLIPHFAHPLPVTVICELVGVPEPERPHWAARSSMITDGATGPDLGDALHSLITSAHTLVDHHRDHPGDDLISALLAPQDDPLTATETVALILNLLFAGHTTTVNLIANGVAALLAHPGQLALLRDDPTLAPQAADELMRWCGPTPRALPRYATEDLHLGQCPIRKGEAVLPVLAAADRDARAHPDPERLDITRTRTRSPQVGFGHGPHRCIGDHLALQGAQVAWTALWDRFPDLTLAVTPDELVREAHPNSWKLTALPVRLHQ
ncbi:cytochrome P450 [Streptomyces sp. C3-3]|uniref:cytochrome P450 family protein n=1 Tax=Streptomyces sp. C3-3 TaxID=2824901 RepID=UPI001B3985BE|nr:cytochrome P450 [Streptomyces sp. C3-3]MBQ1116457.1 cytochrome P450 [Streptomyces sp. C3-3]